MNPVYKKYSALLILLFCLYQSTVACNSSLKRNCVLVFSKTNGFRHKSIYKGIETIKQIGARNNFCVHTSEDSLVFTTKNLKKYKAVIFLNTTGNVLGEAEQKAFENYINHGGGYAGIHAAADCEYNWPWYVALAGGSFESHPEPQKAVLTVIDSSHAAARNLPHEWVRTDEWYNFKNLNKKVNVLITIDEKTYRGGTNGKFHPVSWYHRVKKGRAFYTALGHTEETYDEPLFQQHITGGILYAMGLVK